jgi:hypothetical protein
MDAASTGVLRLARAWVAVTLTLGLATAGHSVGGALPTPALLVLAILLAPLALAATGVRWSFGRAVGALGAGQVLVHVLLTSMAPATQGYATPAHLSHGSPVPSGWAATGTDVVARPDVLGLTVPMIGAHVVATLVTALVVAYAEDVLWAVLARLLPTPVVASQLWAVPAPRPAGRAPRRLRGIPVGAVAGRGPPEATLPTFV